jgi:hypothetical protein
MDSGVGARHQQKIAQSSEHSTAGYAEHRHALDAPSARLACTLNGGAGETASIASSQYMTDVEQERKEFWKLFWGELSIEQIVGRERQ